MSILLNFIKEKFTRNIDHTQNLLPNYNIIDDPNITENSLMLNIGGQEKKQGWKILNIQPADYVDYVGDISDLSQFSDGMFDIVYASHVLEHVPCSKIKVTLSGIYRILSSKGKLLLSVPDLETLCRLFLTPEFDKHSRLHIMSMMYGGQLDQFDFHYAGLTYEFLNDFLLSADFKTIQRVNEFNIFKDTSSYIAYGTPISLNIIAYKSPQTAT